MNTKKIRIDTEPDFIDCPNYNNSLKKLMAKGKTITDDDICKYLNITKCELQYWFKTAIDKIKRGME